MLVLGIVGSPRREEGISAEMVEATLSGAQEAGAETATVYLADYDLTPCRHCGYGCFAEGHCTQDEEASIALREVVEAADALVLASPVYVWQPAGLTALFMEKLRLGSGPWNRPERNGRRALGIAVAGGTGTGVFAALQAIYAWLCVWKFEPEMPLPVARFSRVAAARQATKAGAELAKPAESPLRGVADLMAAYDAISMLRYGRQDEFRWLAGAAAEGLASRGDMQASAAVTTLLAQAERFLGEGHRADAMQAILHAYQQGMRAWMASE